MYNENCKSSINELSDIIKIKIIYKIVFLVVFHIILLQIFKLLFYTFLIFNSFPGVFYGEFMFLHFVSLSKSCYI